LLVSGGMVALKALRKRRLLPPQTDKPRKHAPPLLLRGGSFGMRRQGFSATTRQTEGL
jgi:hypothetical protein